MESRCPVHVPLGTHVTARFEDWRLVGRMDITVQLHPSRLWLFKFLGQSLVVQVVASITFPVQIGQQVDDINHHSQGTFFQALHWSVEATCMLDRGLTSLGLTLSQNKSLIVASRPQLLRAVRRALLEQGISNERADSVRDVGLDANAGHRRSVKIQNKREQKCRKRNAHIKVIQNGLKTQHQTVKLFKTGILPAASYGHAAMGCGRRFVWEKGSRPRAPRQSCIFTLERTETQRSGFRLISFVPGSSSKAKKWGTDLERLTSLVQWAAASANMRKKSKWSMVKGPMTATMANLHDLSIIPASPWKWYPAENPDVDWTYSGGDPGPFTQ